MMKRGNPAPENAFESDEAYLRYKSSQIDVYQLRMFMRGIAIVAALGTLSLYTNSRTGRQSRCISSTL